MEDYITTYTGLHFRAGAPDPDSIDIRDIAHALSLLCRGNGHVKSFFSVGRHCIHCAREARARDFSPRLTLACLLHDASEAYMADIPRPFKQNMPDYRRQENALLDIIYTKYLGSPLTEEEQTAVKQVDDDMLWFDLTELLNIPPERDRPAMKSSFSYEPVSMEETEGQYLALFTELKKEL